MTVAQAVRLALALGSWPVTFDGVGAHDGRPVLIFTAPGRRLLVPLLEGWWMTSRPNTHIPLP